MPKKVATELTELFKHKQLTEDIMVLLMQQILLYRLTIPADMRDNYTDDHLQDLIEMYNAEVDLMNGIEETILAPFRTNPVYNSNTFKYKHN